MVEASRQKTLQGRELLISTILEAVLRTIDRKPTKRKKDSWKCQTSLRDFRIEYLPSGWTRTCGNVRKAFDRLRNRNAHPDWLISEGGGLSDEELNKSLNDIILLSRFYGYMILALAGFKDLKPEFPLPH